MSFEQAFSGANISRVSSKPHHPHNDSIIDELNLLEDSPFEATVNKIESYIYHEQPSVKNYGKARENNNRGGAGQRKRGVKDRQQEADEREWGKSIKEEIMQENRLLEQQLRQPHRNYRPSVRNQNELPPSYPKKVQKKDSSEQRLDEGWVLKLEEQYSNSKVMRLYNFIQRELPACSTCLQPKQHLVSSPFVSFSCDRCRSLPNSHYHPAMAVLYDLENRPRFEDESQVFDRILKEVQELIEQYRRRLQHLQACRDSIVTMKTQSRKFMREVNESKMSLRRKVTNIDRETLEKLISGLPAEYLQHFQHWQKVVATLRSKEDSKHLIEQSKGVIPVHLLEQTSSKLAGNMNKLLNHQQAQPIQLSISEHLPIPIKQLQSAVFVVDGTYNLPVFQGVQHLTLQFTNKKTQRQLGLLFESLPQQIHSLAFEYDHKKHSHISAELFPFLSHTCALPNLMALNAVVRNVKTFSDVLKLASTLTPKQQFSLQVSKHMFGKELLTLPRDYYRQLFGRLGEGLVKVSLKLPQTYDSGAELDYVQLMELPHLCQLKIDRGDRDDPKKRKSLVLLQLENQQQAVNRQKRERIAFKKLLANRVNLLNSLSDSLHSGHEPDHKALTAVINMLP